MKYIKLGNTGIDVSKICLGMMSFGKPGREHGLFPWAVDFEDAKPIFKAAVELGINYFDTANVYQRGTSEEVTGRLIKEFNLDRDDIVVATKVRMEMRPGKPNGSGLSRKAILSEIDKSLKRLGLDYIDLYTIHRLDPLTTRNPWPGNGASRWARCRWRGCSASPTSPPPSWARQRSGTWKKPSQHWTSSSPMKKSRRSKSHMSRIPSWG